jgi:hypothetical protein
MELTTRMTIKRQVQSLLPGSPYDTNHYVLGKSLLNGRLSRFLSSLSLNFGDGSETRFREAWKDGLSLPGKCRWYSRLQDTGSKYGIGLKRKCLVTFWRNKCEISWLRLENEKEL